VTSKRKVADHRRLTMAKVLYRAKNGAVLVGPPYPEEEEADLYTMFSKGFVTWRDEINPQALVGPSDKGLLVAGQSALWPKSGALELFALARQFVVLLAT
jgi:hypothetical protein